METEVANYLLELVADIACVSAQASIKDAISDERYLDFLLPQIALDLQSYIERDPSVHGAIELVLVKNGGFYAVAGYRLSNFLWHYNNEIKSKVAAISLMHHCKVATGAEIHPAARIGKGFVLDHAFGTVIGETAVIGNNCYILNSVILGARGICSNVKGPRHPQIGNNVQIGAFARVFGNINIGDNVFIGPMSLVLEDVKAGSSISAFKNDNQAHYLISPQSTNSHPRHTNPQHSSMMLQASFTDEL